MSDREHERLRRIFELVVAARADLRAQLLARECGGDESLARRVMAMVAAAEEEGFLDDPTGALPHWVDPEQTPTLDSDAAGGGDLGEAPGAKIGSYRLVSKIGEGGFGTVYLAEQEEPVRRHVALKIIKLGMDTRQVVARFELERQSLAMMDHPNIARVFDAGATDQGRPYFVMELVRGESIVEYSDRNKLNIEARLQLFSQVCAAVQHAHTRGIIHRDLKPSNILISTHEGVAHPKVIDFGIAKATASQQAERLAFTQDRELIGTPEYMSPEQAGGDPDIDTRTDVYSLGVVLYELLTGTTPFSGRHLRSAAYSEIQRIIREEEPPAPSTRLSQQSERVGEIAARRHTVPSRLGAVLRGELDWIVMRAMEKERGRRYESASGLAADLRRYLSGEAVMAAPPSRRYRARKFVARHRVGVTAAVLVGSSLVLGIIGTGWGLVRATEAQRRADESAVAARVAQRQATERAAALEKVVKFQSSQLSGVDLSQMGVRLRGEMLRGMQPPPVDAQGVDASKERLLEGVDFAGIALSTLKTSIFQPALDAIRAQFVHEPALRAELLLTVGDTARQLGALDLAAEPIRESLELFTGAQGPAGAGTLGAHLVHAGLMKDLGKFDQAEKELKESIAAGAASLGDGTKEVMELRSNLATVYVAMDRFEESAELNEQAMAWFIANLGPDDPQTLRCMSSLALALNNLGRAAEAEPLYRESLERFKRVLGKGHRSTISAMNNLAGFHRGRKEFEKALEVYEEALTCAREGLGEDHLLTFIITDNMGGIHFAMNDLEGAATLAAKALEGRMRVLGEHHAATLRSCFNLARVLDAQGKTGAAIEKYRRALDGFRSVYGEFHANTISARTSLAGALFKDAKYAECEKLLREELDLLNSRPANAPADRRKNVLSAMMKLYEGWEKAEPGAGHAEQAAKMKQAIDTPEAAKQ